MRTTTFKCFWRKIVFNFVHIRDCICHRFLMQKCIRICFSYLFKTIDYQWIYCLSVSICKKLYLRQFFVKDSIWVCFRVHCSVLLGCFVKNYFQVHFFVKSWTWVHFFVYLLCLFHCERCVGMCDFLKDCAWVPFCVKNFVLL